MENNKQFQVLDEKSYESEMKKLGKGVNLNYLKNSSLEVFTPSKGQNMIRIIPMLMGDLKKSWGLPLWVYYMQGERYLGLDSLDKSKTCPLKINYYKLKASKGDEIAKKFKPTYRILLQILDGNDGDKLKVWEAPKTLVEDFVKISQNPRKKTFIPVDNPVSGLYIFFNKEEESGFTKYNGVRFDTVSFPLPGAVLGKVELFKDILDFKDVTELEQICKNAVATEETYGSKGSFNPYEKKEDSYANTGGDPFKDVGGHQNTQKELDNTNPLMNEQFVKGENNLDTKDDFARACGNLHGLNNNQQISPNNYNQADSSISNNPRNYDNQGDFKTYNG